MKQLTDLHLDISYRSDDDGRTVVKDFYVPCMERSILYRRAVGYFTSHSLALAARGIAHLLRNEGEIHLIASPVLAEEDVKALEAGYERRHQLLSSMVARNFLEVEDRLERDRLSALSWLIESGRLHVRLAMRVEQQSRKIVRGIYHEKIGIFTDDGGNSVAFTGSRNESMGGLIDNFESIDVYWSWEDPLGRVERKISDFERLWENQTTGLEIVNFTDVSKELLSKYRANSLREQDPQEYADDAGLVPVQSGTKIPQIPSEIRLRDYQESIIKNWFASNGRGVVSLATGTGKTITALAAVSRLFEKGAPIKVLIIVCPYQHLVSQWEHECLRFSMQPILAFEMRARWINELTVALNEIHSGIKPFICVITTNATFSSSAFQKKLPHLPAETCLIVDEVHNIGARKWSEALPNNIPLRLGLSATPERWYDDEGTDKIYSYFGKALEPAIGIAEAIKMKVLVPYRYYPILIELDDDERQEYLELSAKIGRLSFGRLGDKDQSDTYNQGLEMLLIKRARLLANAKNKLSALRDLAREWRQRTHMLIYCGDGSVESEVDASVTRQVDEVVRIMGSELGILVAPYTADTANDERAILQSKLDKGELQGLVAIRCLDEGVDIPSVQTAVILASSTNPRQFIQRRGRVLRKYDGKEAADIYDMIVVPPLEAKDSEVERSMLRKELVRFNEFAQISLNAGEAEGVVFELKKRFELMDI